MPWGDRTGPIEWINDRQRCRHCAGYGMAGRFNRGWQARQILADSAEVLEEASVCMAATADTAVLAEAFAGLAKSMIS